MKLAQFARNVMRRGGFEVSRYHPEWDYERNFLHQLESHRVNVVLDVGANTGQYAKGLREAGFSGRIISFEPLAAPYAVLQSNVSSDPLWECHRCALGDSEGTIAINVAGNAGESSSVLPMLKSHEDAFPPANYVATEEVPIHRLDAIVSRTLQPSDVAFLKIDVQGFEKQVLAGAAATVRDHCVGMQLELSFLPLYEGGMLIREALDIAFSLGFTPTGLRPCFTDMRNGRTLQADGLFFREHES